jgi:hypothetical protein
MSELREVTSLSPRDIDGLLNGQIRVVRVREFLSKAEIAALSGRINAVGMESYVGDTKAGTSEQKRKIGPNLFRFKHDTGEYFARVEGFERLERPRLFEEVDVPKRFKDALQAALPPHVSVFRARSTALGRDLSECIVRELLAAPRHTDWIRAEMPHFDAVSRLTDQFAWNVYISTGTSGGYTQVYATEDRSKMGPNTAADVSVRPEPGDLMLFRSRNVHEVTPAEGDRLTVSGFWGPRDDGHIQYWV